MVNFHTHIYFKSNSFSSLFGKKCTVGRQEIYLPNLQVYFLVQQLQRRGIELLTFGMVMDVLSNELRYKMYTLLFIG